MAKMQYYGTGRRKSSVARVRLIPGKGNIIINKGAVTYLAWDYASPSTNEDEIELVPEVEIALIGLSPEGDVRFVDNKGNEVMPGALDTEELLYVVEFLEYLDEDAPKAEEGNEK